MNRSKTPLEFAMTVPELCKLFRLRRSNGKLLQTFPLLFPSLPCNSNRTFRNDRRKSTRRENTMLDIMARQLRIRTQLVGSYSFSHEQHKFVKWDTLFICWSLVRILPQAASQAQNPTVVGAVNYQIILAGNSHINESRD